MHKYTNTVHSFLYLYYPMFTIAETSMKMKTCVIIFVISVSLVSFANCKEDRCINRAQIMKDMAIDFILCKKGRLDDEEELEKAFVCALKKRNIIIDDYIILDKWFESISKPYSLSEEIRSEFDEMVNKCADGQDKIHSDAFRACIEPEYKKRCVD